MHPYAELARQAIEAHIRHRMILQPPAPLPEEFSRRAGVFICLKIRGNLRGCIGTFQPTRATLYEEIVHNAIAAATEDPRFSLVHADELGLIDYTVDVLATPERIPDRSQLDPKKYGLIVAKGFRRGLLLPDLEGVDTIDEQLRITKMKAGIPPADEDVELYRFAVDRYH